MSIAEIYKHYKLTPQKLKEILDKYDYGECPLQLKRQIVAFARRLIKIKLVMLT